MTARIIALPAALALAILAFPASAQGTRAEQSPPKSITFDFDSGVKTTLLADGTVYEEGFEADAMRSLAPNARSRTVTSNVTEPR